MILKGFRFGMILQLAVGPVCLFILTTAINTNLFNALVAVLAVALVDAFYIILAITGAVAFIQLPRSQLTFKISSGIIILFFGLNIILGCFGLNFLPALKLTGIIPENNAFIYALVLTASNPLTILFWSGVFSEKIIEHKLNNLSLFQFGLGCIFATLIFLTGVSLLGTICHHYFSKGIITGLNIAAGLFLIFFSIQVFIKKINILE